MQGLATAFALSLPSAVRFPTRTTLTRRRPRTDPARAPHHHHSVAPVTALRRSSRPKSSSSPSQTSTKSSNSTSNYNSDNYDSNNSIPPPGHSFLDAEESYLQCPQCFALYHVEAEELEGPPRVVACSACLHEWYATGETLLWGDRSALDALESVAAKDSSKDADKAIAAARGVASPSEIQPNALSTVAGSETENDDDETDEFPYDAGDGVEQEQELDGSRDGTVRGKDGVDADTTPDICFDESSAPKASPQSERRSTSRENVPDDRDKGNSGINDLAATVDDGSPQSVFVGNLSFRATEEDLYRAFSGFGAVLSCQVPSDPTGSSRGFGFVEMQSRSSALRAIESLQGASILGRDVSLNVARPRKSNRQSQQREGYNRGGYNSNDRQTDQGRDVRRRKRQGGTDYDGGSRDGGKSSTSYPSESWSSRREPRGRPKR